MTTFIKSQNISLKGRLLQVEQLVGNTPLHPINRIYSKPGIQIFAKLEWQQLGGSVKARPAFNIIKQAILAGELDENKQLLDATSGNTGIAYASIGAALGIQVTLVLPENASPRRKKILEALGAKLIYSSKFEGTDGAQIMAKELYHANRDLYYYADQYANEHNYIAHANTTAPEIWLGTSGKVTHFVAGLGTTGTFTGTSLGLKHFNHDLKAIALQPNNPMHGLEGWKHLETAIVPRIYDETLVDGFLEIDTLDAFSLVKKIALKEGLLVSPSAAANLLGAIQVAESIDRGVIVTTFADDASKYQEYA